MKILNFKAESVKGVKVVEINPNGENCVLSGPNGSGKSSILDAIQKTLCGGKIPLRKGSKKGKIEINIGDYKIRRSISEKGDYLHITNALDLKVSEPRAMLKELIGNLSINPMEFVNLDKKSQLDLLFKIVPGLQQGLDKVEKEIAGYKSERQDINSNVRRLRAKFEDMPLYLEAPEEMVDMLAINKEVDAANEHNKRVTKSRDIEVQIKSKIDSLYKDKCNLDAKINEVEKELLALKRESESMSSKKESLEQELSNINVPEAIDVSEITKRFVEAQNINTCVAANKERAETGEEIDKLKSDYTALGEKVKAAEVKKSELFNTAEMPIEDLHVVNQEVCWRGVPVRSLSTAEKVRVGAAVAVAQNPKAKIILVDDISLLDSDSVKILEKTCKDFQIWSVVNDESGDVGMYITDGVLIEK